MGNLQFDKQKFRLVGTVACERFGWSGQQPISNQKFSLIGTVACNGFC